MTSAEVNARWGERRAPDGDVVVFGDGSLVVLDLVQGPEWQWYEVVRATAWDVAGWIDVDATLASHVHAGFRALAGESPNHGSIGWVALTRDDDAGTLEWLAVSRWSNPFVEVVVDDAAVTAVSTAGRVWTFPRHAPERVRIAPDPECPRRR